MMLDRRHVTMLLTAAAASLLASACSSGDTKPGTGGASSDATSTSSSTGGGGGAGGAMTNFNPSKGCGTMTGVKGEQKLTIDVMGQKRTYLLSVPPGYTGKDPLSLVIVFHERASAGAKIKVDLPIEAKAGEKAIFVYPDGQPQFIANNDTGWELQSMAGAAEGNDLLLVDALVSSISDDYCLDTKRVFAAGFGYGGEFVDTLGCYRGNVVRGIAPIAGGDVFHDEACKGTPAAWIAHGKDDVTIGFAKFALPSRDHWLTVDGCGITSAPVDPMPCESYAGCKPATPVTFCAHTGLGGHVIPDFAAGAIWDFFSALED
ncbi:MAG: PHB depolymerase family esterase [Byssovorax sp.]